MKQLAKLGFQASRMLTDDQMKKIQGGIFRLDCHQAQPGRVCAAAICEVPDGKGGTVTGTCNQGCVCIPNGPIF